MATSSESNMVHHVNPRPYGDLAGTSCVPLQATIADQVVWPLDDSPDMTEDSPRHLAIHGDNLLVRYDSRLEARSRTTGVRIWSKEIFAGVAFSLEPDGITGMSATGFYERYGFDSEVKERFSLPILLEYPLLDFMKRKSSEWVCIYHSLGMAPRMPGDKEIPPCFVLDRIDKQTIKPIWSWQMRGVAIGFRIDSEESRVYMATDEYFDVIPLDAKSKDDVQTWEMPGLVTFSLNHSDDLLVVQDTDEGRLLRQIGSDGEEQWQVELPKADIIWHPPASSPDGGVYLALGSKLLHIRDGEIAWEYPFPSGGRSIYITILSDGSVLAAAGIALVHISSAGEEIITKFLEHELTCRPIVDNDGRVYVGTKGGVVCLK
ncbi:MAG: PQQ-binding-like beta-propeller repeat protein [candidate division Zixibacteria bacterium]|nr:PQQ-binding-like beta-propeller repeat protein [candidate division Zixibacteria bacterium]